MSSTGKRPNPTTNEDPSTNDEHLPNPKRPKYDIPNTETKEEETFQPILNAQGSKYALDDKDKFSTLLILREYLEKTDLRQFALGLFDNLELSLCQSLIFHGIYACLDKIDKNKLKELLELANKYPKKEKEKAIKKKEKEKAMPLSITPRYEGDENNSYRPPIFPFKNTFIWSLSDDVLSSIFQYLQFRELGNMDLVSRHFCFIAHRKSSLYSLGFTDDDDPYAWDWLERLMRTSSKPKDLSRLEGVMALKIPNFEIRSRFGLPKRLTPDFLK